MRFKGIKSFFQPWPKSGCFNSRNYTTVSSFEKSNLNPIKKSLQVYRGDITTNVIQQKTKKKEEKPLILPRRTEYAWEDFPEEKQEISKNKKQKFLKKFKNHIKINKKKYLIFLVAAGVGSFFISKNFKKRKIKKQEKKDLQRTKQQKEVLLQRERTQKEKEIKKQREREREMQEQKEREKKQEEREIQRERERRESKLKFTKRQGVTKKKKKSKS